MKEPDRPSTEDKVLSRKEEMLMWEDYKLERVEKIIIEHKIAKHGVMAAKLD